MSPVKAMKIKIFVVAFLLCVVAFGILIYRLLGLQITDAQVYQQRALAQQMSSTAITADRGTIYDRNGNVLAKSATVWTVVLSPAEVKDDEELNKIANKLSELMGVDPQKVIEMGQDKESYYREIKPPIEQDVREQLLQFIQDEGIGCINMIESSKRYYPYGNFAAQLLGFVGSDNQGSYGLEAYYNSVLSGTPGRVLTSVNGWGTDMPFQESERFEATDGNSLVLTIDEGLQHFLEKNLELALEEHDVRNRASGVIINAKTGEVLAMATKPDFDPNNPQALGNPDEALEAEKLKGNQEAYKEYLGEKQYLQWSNKVIGETYEPGSVFKIVTAAAALETGAQTLTSNSYYCPGYYMVGEQRYGCWQSSGHGMQTFEKAMQNSCNPAFIQIGQSIGGTAFYEYFNSFGLSEATGIDLPGEEVGISHSLSQLQGETGGGTYLASTSFGQTFQVTPLQMAMAVAAAVNGGTLYQPYVVKQVLDSDGNVVSTTQPTAKRQVISEETSAQIRTLVEAVVADGSGRNAQVPGYRIGGKTGTTEKLTKDKNIITGEYEQILSFAGIAPMEDPEIVVLVTLDEPGRNGGFGSTIAAPVVGAILEEALPYLGYEPQFTQEEVEDTSEKTVPYLETLVIHDAQGQLRQLGLDCKIVGDGVTVLKQVPSVTEKIPKGGTVVLFTDEASMETMVEVPDVTGETAQAANKKIYGAGLNMRIAGEDVTLPNVKAATQYPAAGEKVSPGTVVEVRFQVMEPEEETETADEGATMFEEAPSQEGT